MSSKLYNRFLDCQNTLHEHFKMRRKRLYWRKPTTWAVKKGQRAGTVDAQGRRVVQFRGRKYLESNLIKEWVYS